MINLSEELFGEALAHHRAGRLYDAVAVYEEMLTNQPDHPDILNNFGACLMDLGRGKQRSIFFSRPSSCVQTMPIF